MLKSVTNSLGGTFTLDYAHTTPTYGLPGGKWVMSALTVDDGIHPEFLKYDSFVDCGMLFSIPLKKLMEGEYSPHPRPSAS